MNKASREVAAFEVVIDLHLDVSGQGLIVRLPRFTQKLGAMVFYKLVEQRRVRLTWKRGFS